METPTVEVRPCAVCRGLLEIIPGAHFDLDLRAIVCADCARQLIFSHAWLKHCGLPSCTRVPR
jgi:hypothetical protein